MIVRTFFRQREDGTDLCRTYSDKNMMIRQIETDTLYSEAVDVENAPYSYEETTIAIKFNEEQEQAIEQDATR